MVWRGNKNQYCPVGDTPPTPSLEYVVAEAPASPLRQAADTSDLNRSLILTGRTFLRNPYYRAGSIRLYLSTVELACKLSEIQRKRRSHGLKKILFLDKIVNIKFPPFSVLRI